MGAILAGNGGSSEALERAMGAKKMNIRQLIDAANYGEPSPSNLPSDEDLRKIGVAADLGYAVPPHICNLPNNRNANDFLFPDLVLAWNRFAHGSFLQWRHDPAIVINMITQSALIASDRSLGGPAHAAHIATACFANCREQTWSGHAPTLRRNESNSLPKLTRST